jgi:predicted lactoylglutathione lyase
MVLAVRTLSKLGVVFVSSFSFGNGTTRRHNETMEPRLSLVTLGVNDLARARRFYEKLGWKNESPDESVVFFQSGGMVVGLWDRASLAESCAIADSGGWGGITLAHNVTSPEEVDAVLGEAEAAGATIARPGEATFWGGYAGVFLDLDGHPWEVAHNPGWSLDAAGSVHLT